MADTVTFHNLPGAPQEQSPQQLNIVRTESIKGLEMSSHTNVNRTHDVAKCNVSKAAVTVGQLQCQQVLCYSM